MKTLIKNGTIITESSEFKADILIEDEKIKAIGVGFDEKDIDLIEDATGKIVMPGGVDNHSHYDAVNTDGETSNAGYETSYGSAIGGTTTTVEFAANDPGKNMVDSVKYRIEERTKGKMAVDYGVHALCTEVTEDSFGELKELVEMGIPTLKLFMAYKPTSLYVDDANVFKFMREAKKYGITMSVHAENADLLNLLRDEEYEKGHTEPKWHITTRPPFVESECTQRAITLADAAGCPLCVVHVSCKEASDVIAEARAKGMAVIGETCTHYLTLDASKLDNPDFDIAARYVCSPALRTVEQQEALFEALNKDELSIVASDHSPIPLYQKHWGEGDFRKIPNGCPSSGDRMQMLWTAGVATGKMTKQKYVEVACTTPAKLCGLYPQKGTIQVGSDADIVLFDPDYEGVVTNEDNPTGIEYNIFEGMKQVGRVDKVFLRGKKIVENHKYIGNPGEGKFIKGKPFGLAYDLLKK